MIFHFRLSPAGYMACWERMVREINETQVPEEEILSNHAYFYYAQEGKLQLGKEMCIDREDNE
jgi:hypothetical protein